MNASKAPATGGWLVLVTVVHLVWWLGDCELVTERQAMVVDFPMGLGNCSLSRLMVLLLLCVLQMRCLEVEVAPTDCRVQCGLHLYLLFLAAPGPMGAGTIMVCADWPVLASCCRLTRSW
jgi:hypothetical protein